jgi:hypothetical protein
MSKLVHSNPKTRRTRRRSFGRTSGSGSKSRSKRLFEVLENRFLLNADVSAAPEPTPLLEVNDRLLDVGLNIAVEAVEYYTIGEGRPADRVLQQPYRWVPDDPLRFAQGNDITYLVDLSEGQTASGLTAQQTEAAIDSAMSTWDGARSLRQVDIVKRPDPGADPDIYDWLVAPAYDGQGNPAPGQFGELGFPYYADIVHAGWLPKAYFDALEPGGGESILGFSVTFVWIDDQGFPTDINGDNYLDTALNEVYYNDNFGDPNGTLPALPWGIDVPLPGIDVETVALHESGHSLGADHFGPPPSAVMNPVYAGIRHSPSPSDLAAMAAVWQSWDAPSRSHAPHLSKHDTTSVDWPDAYRHWASL